jgi:hypothetical protein
MRLRVQPCCVRIWTLQVRVGVPDMHCRDAVVYLSQYKGHVVVCIFLGLCSSDVEGMCGSSKPESGCSSGVDGVNKKSVLKFWSTIGDVVGDAPHLVGLTVDILCRGKRVSYDGRLCVDGF